jgi:Fe-S-cluster containining protein
VASLESLRFAQAADTAEADTPADAAALAATRVDAEVEARDEGAWACRPACAACCHLKVFASGSEALRIARFVGGVFSPGERAALRARIEKVAAEGRALDPGAWRRLGLRCAFLGDDALCRIYEVRPLKCRVHVSRRREACEDPGAAVPLDGWLVKVGAAVQHGLEDAPPVELHAAVWPLLSV